jgi:glycosyltransferase involved in cell wall biosynthesis
MRVLVNATTLVVGGGIQIGVSFIEEAFREKRFSWKFLVSPGIYDHISEDIRRNSDIQCVPISPAKPYSGAKSRRLIRRICSEWTPHLVYSIGFPSYIRFRQPEIGRYTNPWEINFPPLPWHLYPEWTKRLKIRLGIWYRQYWSKCAAYIETQTEDARSGIHQRIGFPLDRIRVFPNSPNRIFIEAGQHSPDLPPPEAPFRIFCLAAPYPHKHLDIIPDVALALKQRFGLEAEFLLTLPEAGPLWNTIRQKALVQGVGPKISNLGVLKLQDCIAHYRKSHLVFLPTLLEVFSATYLEAMAMKKPIVTTDLSFAHDNCGDAALFFKAGDAVSAAEAIHRVLNDPAVYRSLISRGTTQLARYPDNAIKYQNLFHWFEMLIKKNNRHHESI